MQVTRIWDPDKLKPLHVVMIVIVTVTLAGSFLFLSVPASPGPVDGALEWKPNSPLRALVTVLCLNYALPTFHADTVKSLIFALAAGVALLVTGIAVSRGAAPGAEITETDIIEGGLDEGEAAPVRRQIAPLVGAQVLAGVYLLWSLASCGWSNAPGLALGGTALIGIQFLWAFSLGNTMNRVAARAASYALLAITAVTALVAIWYFEGRNPHLRAKFPFGNPIFLSTCLIPGVVVGISILLHQIGAMWGRPPHGSLPDGRRSEAENPLPYGRGSVLILAAASVALGAWAFYLARSRGPGVGLGCGLLALVYFILPRGRRWIAVAVAGVVVIGGGMMFMGAANAPSAQGRDATLRTRVYAWTYAMEMFEEHPLVGHGQGGFALAGDAYAARKRDENILGLSDVESDPRALHARLDHAHNEWLEVAADLGAVGLVLMTGVLLLTLYAGTVALEDSRQPGRRAVLTGLMASLIGLCAAECFGVGLRLGAVPVVFFTVLGLIWACSRSLTTDLVGALSSKPTGRLVFLAASVFVGIAILAMGRSDFAGARSNFRASALMGAGKYQEAVAVLSAPQRQLSPARALRQMRYLADANMRRATVMQNRCFELVNSAAQAPRSDDPRLAQAHDDRVASLESYNRAAQIVTRLRAYSPGLAELGWVEYWLNRILLQYALAEGNESLAARYAQEMADALSRELSRQPGSLKVTLEYLRTTGGRLDLPTILATLARPLRYQAVGTSFVDFTLSLADKPEFDAEFGSIFSRIAALVDRPVIAPPEDALALWAPEILRIAAVVQFARGDYEAAKDALALAATTYEKMGLDDQAPMGMAGCLVELAEARFMISPQDPIAAIETLRRANAIAPDSEQGREFKKTNRRLRLAVFHLSAGDEAAARGVLLDNAAAERIEAAGISRLLSAAYVELCYRMIQGGVEVPESYANWLSRAVELDRDNAGAYGLAAHFALRSKDFEGVVRNLRAALRSGASPESVLEVLGTAREEYPLFKPFDDLWRELVPDDAGRAGQPG